MKGSASKQIASVKTDLRIIWRGFDVVFKVLEHS